MTGTTIITAEKPKDYADYWEAQVLTVRILQNCGLKVGVKDRLPLFRLWNLINTRVTGTRKEKLLELLDTLVKLRGMGVEPPHNGKKYV